MARKHRKVRITPEAEAIILEQDWYSFLLRDDRERIMGILANAITALRRAPEWQGALSFDEFSLRFVTRRETPWGCVEKWSDQEDRLLANWLQHHGIIASDGVAAKAAQTVARDRSFHPVRDYLDSLHWDGTGRLDDWLTLYLGVEASDLTRAFAAKWPISAVARIYQPGCKADHCLITEGSQGVFKSTAFRILGEPWFTDDIETIGSKDASLTTIGAWIIELPELDALNRAEQSRVKAFMSRPVDRFRPPYGRNMIESPRQCVFAGTCNQSEYLRDETGGRRFWPVTVGCVKLEPLRRDRDQLWAEAVARYRNGEHWWLEDRKLNDSAAEAQDARYQCDAWEPLIADWIDGQTAVTKAQILRVPLQKLIGNWSRADEMRVGSILRRLGWKPRNNGRPRAYVPPTSEDNQPTSE
jgi:predicted P-loop ATPase